MKFFTEEEIEKARLEYPEDYYIRCAPYGVINSKEDLEKLFDYAYRYPTRINYIRRAEVGDKVGINSSGIFYCRKPGSRDWKRMRGD